MLTRAHHSFEPFDQAVAHLRDYFDRLVRDGSDWSDAGRGRLSAPPHPETTS